VAATINPPAIVRPTSKIKGIKAAIEKTIEKSTAARLKNEFTWQWTNGNANANKFREEVFTPGQGIKVYGFVQEDSPIIQLIHGIGRFFALLSTYLLCKITTRESKRFN
jgi:hypothetical protein